MTPRLLAACSGLLVLTVGSAALGQTPAPGGSSSIAGSDLVLLANGASYRGLISEKVPGGDVVIVTVAGETKRFPMSDVTYAGPWAERPGAEVKTPLPGPTPTFGPTPNADGIVVGGPTVKLAFGGAPGTTYFVQTGVNMGTITASNGATATVSGARYSQICTAPCEATLPFGTYSFAVGNESRTPAMVEAPIKVESPARLDGKYDSRAGTRAAGWMVSILGSLGGSTLVVLGIGDATKNSQHSELIYLGGAVFLGSLIAGYLMIHTKDRATITVVPMAQASLGGEAVTTTSAGGNADVRRASSLAGLPGLTLAGSF